MNKKILIPILVFFFLLAGLATALILVKRNQSIQQVTAANYYICSWYRLFSDQKWFNICEGPQNYSDAITMGNSLGYCQMLQDDSNYLCCEGETDYLGRLCNSDNKIVVWKHKGPRGQVCEENWNFCSNSGSPTDKCLYEGESWNFAECVKCKSLEVNWDVTNNRVVINNLTAHNWHPMLKRSGTDTVIDWQSPQTQVDFRVMILEDGSQVKGIDITSGDSRINCSYNTTDSYDTRDNTQHFINCSLQNLEIPEINFTPGKKYTVSALVRISSYGEAGWINYDYIDPGTQIFNCSDEFIYNPSATPTQPVATLTPTNTPSPTSTPIPNLTPAAQCLWVQAYDNDWNRVTDFNSLTAGQTIYLGVYGNTENSPADLDQARFRINSGDWVYSSQERDIGSYRIFYTQYTIPAATYSFRVVAEVHHPTLGWY